MKSLPEVFRKITIFLNKEQYDYLLIGGIAVGALGDPRMTQDIDFCLFVSKSQIKGLLKKAKDAGFSFQEKKIDELPVVDAAFKPVGMLDIQDILRAGLV